jgi:hypothetical protein
MMTHAKKNRNDGGSARIIYGHHAVIGEFLGLTDWFVCYLNEVEGLGFGSVEL